MKKELEEELFAINPAWFDRTNPRTSLMCFGFECGNGWFEPLKTLLTALKSVAPPDFSVMQVKEKFGGLRFYTGGEYDDEVAKLISKAEATCDETCELCGSPGTLRGKAWLVTLCDTCHNKPAAR